MHYKPDWQQIAKEISMQASEQDLQTFWLNETMDWLHELKKKFGYNYHIYESKNFIILTDENDKYIKIFSEFLEKTLKRVLKILKNIAQEKKYGKYVCLIFSDLDDYYEYLNMFMPEEGDFGLSSGVFLNTTYNHFAFPHQEITYAEPIAVHELTHATLSHLPIPTWLNEGIAASIEEVLSIYDHLKLNRRLLNRLQTYWDEENIQTFWTGESFYFTDEGQELSYYLALLIIRVISRNYKAFTHFVNNSHYQDAGMDSAIQNLGVDLGDLVAGILGEGNWQPKIQL